MRQSPRYERFPRRYRARTLRLTRVYTAAALFSGDVVELPPESGAHLIKVLRARSGDELVLFNGDGREFDGAIAAVRGARVSVLVGDGRTVDRESPLAITLVQCVPRGDRMDFIVQKATELGIARIVPVLSQRSVVRLDPSQAESKATHWRAVAVSACEQCGRNRIPAVEAARPLLAYLGESSASPLTRLVFDADGAHLSALPPVSPGASEIAIGPEGGLASEELEAFRLAGYARVGMGPRILRTETAALAALAWLQSRFGDM